METETKKYSLPIESLPGLKFEQHLSDLREIAAFLESRGIRTKNTRIERYIDYLEELVSHRTIEGAPIFKNAVDSRFKSGADWLLYVLREIHELMWILRGLKVHVPQGANEKLATLVSGSDFAALDKQSHSRDVQFELRIASYFCQSGCDVDLRTDTDIVATSPEFAFFVECKRVASMAQLSRRLSKAKTQLETRTPRKHGGKQTYGCIAADVTAVAFPHNGLTFGLTNAHSRDQLQEKLGNIVRTIEKLPLFESQCDIVQYWFQIHIPALIKHPPTTMTRFSSIFMLNPILRAAAMPVVKQMCAINEIGDARDERETPPKKLKRRTRITLPIGSEIWMPQEIVREFIERGSARGRELEEVIASLKFFNLNHEFTFHDFQALIDQLPESYRKEMGTDIRRVAAILICEMYLQRFPFEEEQAQPEASS